MADRYYRKYVLMHKNISVADIELDNASASVCAIVEILAPAHVPVGIPIKKGEDEKFNT